MLDGRRGNAACERRRSYFRWGCAARGGRARGCRADGEVPALFDALGETLKDADGHVPVDAGVGDANSIVQRLPRLELLIPLVDIRFDHDAKNVMVPGG